jgi:hypothetical protein
MGYPYQLSNAITPTSTTEFDANFNWIAARCGLFCGTSTGSGAQYNISPSPAIAAYQDGQSFTFIADHSATGLGANQLSVSGLGYVYITDVFGDGVTLLQNTPYLATYSASIPGFVVSPLPASTQYALLAAGPLTQLELGSLTLPVGNSYAVTCSTYPGQYFEYASDPSHEGTKGPEYRMAFSSGVSTTYVRTVVVDDGSGNAVLKLQQSVITPSMTTTDTYLTMANVYLMI